MTQKINYKKVGLKAGLEIHCQLDTKHKLFCNCFTNQKEKEPIASVKRKMHPVASELGEVDIAAQYEYLRNRTFHYQVFKNEVCLVDLDESPPLPLNQEALEIGLQVALLLNCSIPEEIHVMRKIVIDGSTPMGFQRTMIVGNNGFLKLKGKKIPIIHVSLEEDAGAIVKEENGNVHYRLNRLGVPLVEISTGLLIEFSPQEIQEIAYMIGMVCKSCRTKHGIGTIRQDLNVSIKNGARIEIKGLQDLGLLAKVVELEVERQLSLPKVKEETRAALPDGTTKFARPLPGSARLYPETDVMPVTISKEFLEGIKKNLPEPLTEKLSNLKKRLKLSDELAREILRSDYLEIFEKIVKTKKVEASIIANTFVSTVKDLEKREGIKTENLTEKHFTELFDFLARGKIVKEGIPEILKYLAASPDKSIDNAIEELNLKAINTSELKKIVKDVLAQPGLTVDKAVGLVMSRVRGRIEAQTVMKIVKKVLKK